MWSICEIVRITRGGGVVVPTTIFAPSRAGLEGLGKDGMIVSAVMCCRVSDSSLLMATVSLTLRRAVGGWVAMQRKIAPDWQGRHPLMLGSAEPWTPQLRGLPRLPTCDKLRRVRAVTQTAIRREKAEIDYLCTETSSSDQLFAALSERLQRIVPHDGALWFPTDPGTMLATGARIENFASGHCETYWQREFLVQDVNLFRDLARAERPVATLLTATDGHPRRSARYREFLSPQSYGDELRSVLRTDAGVWGLLSLTRENGSPAFEAQDTGFIAEFSGLVATALRRIVLAAPSPTPRLPAGPGLMLFDPDGALASQNQDAETWLGLLPDAQDLDDGGRVDVATLIARARAVAAGHEHLPARSRVRTVSGEWLVMHASCLRDTAGRRGATAVVIEAAHASEIAPIIIEAYSLTPREQEITQLIARGASTSEIASSLFLSVHTVRDYIKTIFEKTSVSGRGELVAKLFAEHYAEPLHMTGIHVER